MNETLSTNIDGGTRKCAIPVSPCGEDEYESVWTVYCALHSIVEFW